MDRYFSRTVGIPIVTDSGYKISRVYDVLINSETGKVVGFITSPRGNRVLAPIDILTWNHVLIVHDEESILETGEIHQAVEAQRKNIRVYQNRVITKSGIPLGKVIDYMIHDKMFVLTKIVVAKIFLGIITYDRRIIAHKDIIEIKKAGIIVKDPLRTVPVKAEAKLRIDTVASV
jgi:uncharacterized protein YrrD